MRRPGEPHERGWSLVEVVLVIGVSLVGTGLALAAFGPFRDASRAVGAARHLAATLQRTRLDAMGTGRAVGFRFVDAAGAIAMQAVADGNGNGLRVAEIEAGVDVIQGRPRRLADDFAGVRFAVVHDLPGLEGGEPLAAGSDPIRLGGALLAFGPTGSCTSGTLYLASREGRQFAVRILGATGRIRVFELDRRLDRWASR